MQQRTCHREIVHVGRRRHDRVDKARVRVDTDVRLQAEEPLVPLPGLVPDGGRMPVRFVVELWERASFASTCVPGRTIWPRASSSALTS